MPAYGPLLGCLTYLVFLIHHLQGGPITSRRLTREIYPEIEPENDVNQSQVCIVGDVVYGVEETVPAEQPCLKCKCQPPGVQCEATRCNNKKPGCKAVHRPNQCCPDYQCECEYNGKKYSNGERLETSPGNECKVCYCRGGEIQCADVSCYVRNDCEGKQVLGQCCPKYDHCPTRDSVEKISNVPANASSSTYLISEIIISPTSSSTETFVNDEPSNLPNQEGNGIQSDVSSIQQGNAIQNPKITIQEIIPEVREIPITPNPKQEETPETQGALIIEETKTTQENQIGEERPNDLFVTDSDAESSEITEVIQNPPPVIRIGDNLLFLKRNELVNEKDASSTPASIITLVGAEGLQRGGIEEIAENITHAEDSMPSTQQPYSTSNFEDNTNDLTSASSSHILSLVKKKRKPTGLIQLTTSSPILISSTSSTTDYATLTSTSIDQNISISETAPSLLPSTVSDPIEPTMLSQNSSETKEPNADTVDILKVDTLQNSTSYVQATVYPTSSEYTPKNEKNAKK